MIICPDIHGRTFWKNIPTNEKIIFLGDYVDPYTALEGITSEDAYQNFLDLLDFIEEHDCIALYGNHDWHYLNNTFPNAGRMDYRRANDIAIELTKHNKRLKFAHEETFNNKKVLFSHAGITNWWLKQHNLSDNFNANSINELAKKQPGIFDEVSYIRGGFDETGSPLWSDVREEDRDIPGYDIQIFGHTLLKGPVISEHWACLDCRKPFRLDEKTLKLESL